MGKSKIIKISIIIFLILTVAVFGLLSFRNDSETLKTKSIKAENFFDEYSRVQDLEKRFRESDEFIFENRLDDSDAIRDQFSHSGTLIDLGRGNPSIVSFANSPEGELRVSGGCQSRIFENYVEYKGDLYEVNINNLYQIFEPKSINDFTNLAYLQVALTPSNDCSVNYVLELNPEEFNAPEEFSCEKESFNITPELNMVDGSYNFSYYTIYNAMPFTLTKSEITFEAKTREAHGDTKVILKCDSGILL